MSGYLKNMKKNTFIHTALIFFGFFISFIIIELLLHILSFFIINSNATEFTDSSKIGCFGDSFTYGLGADHLKGSYPAYLKKYFNNEKKIINFGKPGTNSFSTFTHIQKHAGKNDIVIVLTGLNNYWNTEGFTHEHTTAADKLKTVKLIKLLLYRYKNMHNNISKTPPQYREENNIFLTKKTASSKKNEIKENWTDFFEQYLTSDYNSDNYQYYKNLYSIFFSTIPKQQIKTSYNAHKNKENINFLYFYYLFKNSSIIDHEIYLNSFSKNFSQNHYYFLLKAMSSIKKREYNNALSCLKISIDRIKKNDIEAQILKFIISKLMSDVCIKLNNHSIFPNIIETIFSADSFFYMHTLSEHYIKTGQFKKAALLLSSCSILNDNMHLTSVKNAFERLNNGHFEWAALSFKEILFENSAVCISFDHVRKNFHQHIKNVEQILAYFFIKNTNDPRLWATIGHIFSEKNNIIFAKSAFSKAISNPKCSFEEYLLYSYFLQDIGATYGVLASLENALRLSNNNIEILLELIRFSLKIHDIKKAEKYISTYEKSVKDTNNNFTILKAEYFSCSGEIKKCLKILSDINSDNTDILLKKALLYKKHNKLDDALHILNELLKRDEISKKVYLETVHILYLKRQYHYILEQLKKWFMNDPQNIFIYMTATIYKEIGENENAEKYFKLAYENDPENTDICYDLLKTLVKNKNIKELHTIIQKLSSEIFEKDPEFLIFKAFSYYYQNDIDSALRIIYETDEKKPYNKKFILDTLDFFYSIKNEELFLEFCTKYNSFLKDNSEFHFLKALMSFYSNKKELAFSELKNVIRSDNKNYFAYNMAGRLTEDTNEAIEYFKKAFLLSFDVKTYFYNIKTFIPVENRSECIKEAENIIEQHGTDAEKKLFHTLHSFSQNDNNPHSLLTEHLKQIMIICQKRNCKLIVLTYPFFHSINENIRSFADSYNITLVDNEKIFLNTADQSYFVPDMHCNNKGYELIAKNVFKILNGSDK